MSSVARQFGTSGSVRNGNGYENSVVYYGTIDDASVVTLEFEPGGIYELFTAEYNASTGAFRGNRAVLMKIPEEAVYGTVAIDRGNEYASSNSGITMTWNSDSTLSIQRNAATYAVKYVVLAIGRNIGNPSSAVGDAEAARDQAEIYAQNAADSATAAAASETAAALAVGHYPKVENGYWYVWDVVNQDWVDTGVKAQSDIPGPQGVSIDSVTLASGTHAPGTTDTYDVNLDDSTVAGQFTVYNGADGQGSPGSQLPLMDGTAAVGTANAYAREDHVHPSDTSRGTAVLLGTDTSGNTTQNSFELSDSLANYTAIQIVGLFNWASTTNIHYFVTPQVPILFLETYTTYNIMLYRQPATGSSGSNMELYIDKVDNTHIKITKGRTDYSFRTLYIYGIR